MASFEVMSTLSIAPSGVIEEVPDPCGSGSASRGQSHRVRFGDPRF